MKKYIVSILSLMMLFCSVMACAECSVAADEIGCWLLKDNALYQLDEQFEIQEKRVDFDCTIQCISAWKGNIYAAGAVEDGAAFYRLSEMGLQELFVVHGEQGVTDFAVLDAGIVVLWQLTEQDAQQLPYGAHRVEAYTLQGQSMELGMQWASAVAGIRGNECMIAVSENYSDVVYRMDLVSGDQQLLLENAYVKALASDGEQMYMFDDSGLHMLTEEGSTVVQMMRCEDDVDIAIFGNSVMGVLRMPADDAYEVFHWNPDAEKTVLTMVNVDPGLLDDRMDKALELLRAEYPNVEVQFIDINPTVLSTKLMAQDTDMDILNVSPTNTNHIIAAGALMDLSGEKGILQELEGWIDVVDMAYFDGELVGIPSYIWGYSLYVNPQLAVGQPASIADGECSWQEFFAEMNAYNCDENGDGEVDIVFLTDAAVSPLWYRQYVASYERLEDVVFDTPLFRELAEQFRDGLKSGRIADYWSDGLDRNRILYWQHQEDSPRGGSQTIPLPMLGDVDVQVGSPKLFAVSNASKNKEIAIRFLEIYASRGVQVMRNTHYLVDTFAYEDDARFMDEKQIAQLEEMKALYGRMKNDLITTDFTFAGSHECMQQYMAGELTTDELVEQLQSILMKVVLG